MTNEDRLEAQILCERLIKLVDRPDIVLIMLTDNDLGNDNTRVMCNLTDKVDVIRYIGEMIKLTGVRENMN